MAANYIGWMTLTGAGAPPPVLLPLAELEQVAETTQGSHDGMATCGAVYHWGCLCPA